MLHGLSDDVLPDSSLSCIPCNIVIQSMWDEPAMCLAPLVETS